jgi:methionyl-tRNA formyltransferase
MEVAFEIFGENIGVTGAMKIVVLTQNDIHFIPANIEKLIKIATVDVVSVGIVRGPAEVGRKRWLFLRAFGGIQCGAFFLIGLVKHIRAALFLMNRVFRTSLRPISIKNVCYQNMIEFFEQVEPNSLDFIDYIKRNNIDLIVSFSAPQVFGPKLLSAPKMGCINLHCSLLPEFSGIMPSFWTLFKRAKKFGVTVHFMDTEIDNGEILRQAVLQHVPRSIYDNIKATKTIGGGLMAETVRDLAEGRQIKVEQTGAPQRTYFGWPSLSDLNEFRRQGGRFI